MAFHPRPHALVLAATMVAAVPALAGERPLERPLERPPGRLCPENAPEGVRLPPRAGCRGAEARRTAPDDGFRQVDGVKVRIGGSVGAATDMRSR